MFWLVAILFRTPALRLTGAGPLLRRYLPLAAGLLFAVHPVATEAVTYIVQRFASLATLFYLLSLALYLRAKLSLEADAPARRRGFWFFYLLSSAAAIAAMKTKEISFTLPFVALMSELLFFGRGKRLVMIAPLVAAALLVPLGHVTHPQQVGETLDEVGRLSAAPEVPRSVYLLTQSRVVVTYLRLLLLPVGQNLDYDFSPSYFLTDSRVLFAIAILVSVAAFAVLLLVRARQASHASGILVFFGIAWFFVTLSVESSVIPIRDAIFEHRLYLPSCGAMIALARYCCAQRRDCGCRLHSRSRRPWRS